MGDWIDRNGEECTKGAGEVMGGESGVRHLDRVLQGGYSPLRIILLNFLFLNLGPSIITSIGMEYESLFPFFPITTGHGFCLLPCKATEKEKADPSIEISICLRR